MTTSTGSNFKCEGDDKLHPPYKMFSSCTKTDSRMQMLLLSTDSMLDLNQSYLLRGHKGLIASDVMLVHIFDVNLYIGIVGSNAHIGLLPVHWSR